jgi:ABC-type lipoprotein export system ATPase subunit
MQIRRIALKNIRSLGDFDRSFEDQWTGRTPEALLLLGPNGSGKTTLLEAMSLLWQVLGEMLENAYQTPTLALGSLREFDRPGAFMGMQIQGLEQEPLWIAIGDEDSLSPFAERTVGSHRMYLLGSGQGHKPTFTRYIRPKQRVYSGDSIGGQWLDSWKERFTANRLGKCVDLPNLLFLPGEDRTLPKVEEPGPAQPEPKEYQWFRRYSPIDRRKGSIENYLFNLRVLDDGRYDRIVHEVNQFLGDKRLDRFDERTMELMVATEGGARHPVHLLSAGEKQVLLTLAYITRWLEPGGIVLIDEPDLHLHVSLTRSFTSHLRRMIADKGGQLIVASHEPALWEQFTQSQRVELGSIAEVLR